MVVALKQFHTAGWAQRITPEYVELVDKSLSTSKSPSGYKNRLKCTKSP